MVKKILNPKIACLDFNLQKARMKLGVQIVVDDPDKLDAIRERYLYYFYNYYYYYFLFKSILILSESQI